MHRNRINASFKLVIALTLCVVSAQTAQTQENLPQYDVELVIFRFTHPNVSEEDWAYEEAHLTPDVEDAAASTTPTTTSTMTPPALSQELEPEFPALTSGSLKLAGIAERLQKNPAYEVLAHIGWTQPGFAAELAPALELNRYLPADSSLSGTVTLVRSRQLHLNFDLILRAPEGRRYVLRQQRTIQRAGKTHYIDHPYFGAIALVTAKN